MFRDYVSYWFIYWTTEPSKRASAKIWEFIKIGELPLLAIGLCLVHVLATAGETTLKTICSPVQVMTSHIDGGRNKCFFMPRFLQKKPWGILEYRQISPSCWFFWCLKWFHRGIPVLLLQKGLACRVCAGLLVAFAGHRGRCGSHRGCHAMTQEDRKGQVQACRAEFVMA